MLSLCQGFLKSSQKVSDAPPFDDTNITHTPFSKQKFFVISKKRSYAIFEVKVFAIFCELSNNKKDLLQY